MTKRPPVGNSVGAVRDHSRLQRSSNNRLQHQVVGAVPETPKQIVIVDDCPTAGTRGVAAAKPVHSDGIWRGMSLNDKGELVLSADGLQYHGEFWFTVCFTNTIEARCGSANRVLLRFRGCDVTQDAELEYDPADWAQMLPLIIARKVADVVYGSRFYGRPHRSLYFHHYIGNRLISFFNLLYDEAIRHRREGDISNEDAFVCLLR